MPAKRGDYQDNPSLSDRHVTYPVDYRGYEPLLQSIAERWVKHL
jgi:hypothetical protein